MVNWFVFRRKAPSLNRVANSIAMSCFLIEHAQPNAPRFRLRSDKRRFLKKLNDLIALLFHRIGMKKKKMLLMRRITA
jgi:hypothetical protein